MDKRIIYPIATLLIGLASYYGFSALKQPPQKKTVKEIPTFVTVEPIKRESLHLKVNSYGIAQPKNRTSLVAEVNGKITFIAKSFDRGQHVSEGELLARIDDHDHKTRLVEAQASLATAKAALSLERAQGKVARDEWDNISDASPTKLSLRKPQLKQELARVKAAEAALARAKMNLARTEIRAPYDAIINERSVSLGSFVNSGGPIGQVLSTEEAEFNLPITREQLKFLEDNGMGAQVLLRDSTDDPQTWTGEVVGEVGVVDEVSRMTKLIVRVNDPYSRHKSDSGEILRFGTYLTAEIFGQKFDKAVEIPEHLVFDDSVRVVAPEGTLKIKPVTIVRHYAGKVVISAGLEDGDLLITSALSFPKEGMNLVFDKPKSTSPPSSPPALKFH